MGLILRKGRVEGVPYSLSRWTDVPAAKWAWFLGCLDEGEIVLFDQRDGLPGRWSLLPEDVHGLTFWTKDPTNLLRDAEKLRVFPIHVHLTATGWVEVEKGAPNLLESVRLLGELSDMFGPKHVSWRFSPIPFLPLDDVVSRFSILARAAHEAGIQNVFVAFLQENDLMPEKRSVEERRSVLLRMAEATAHLGLQIQLCNDDSSLFTGGWGRESGFPRNLQLGVCAPPTAFESIPAPRIEHCGCAMMADPFTINESCTLGCSYCYAADQSLSPKKRNTTRGLTVLR